jgi:REP element-mobilizing transposase RayT
VLAFSPTALAARALIVLSSATISDIVSKHVRPIRVAQNRYVGRHSYFATICRHNRAPLLSDLAWARTIVGELMTAAVKHSFALPAYCAMPNHLHVLAMASSPDADLLKFSVYFKQKTAFRYQRQGGHRLWPPRYYEYILRALSGSTTIDWKARYQFLGEWMPPWKGKEKAPG